MKEVKKLHDAEFGSIEEEVEARIKVFRDGIANGKKLLTVLEDGECPAMAIEIDNCGDEMTCIPAYVDADAIVVDDGRNTEWFDVECLLKSLILMDDKRDAVFVGVEPGRGFVISKAFAQRILEPFLLEERYKHGDAKRLDQAIKFATEAHKGQFRKGTGTPYIVHPLEVMNILQSMDADVDLMIAGLLHDVVEDTDVKISEIERRFGLDVAALVAAHSENKSWRWENRKKSCICDIEYGSERFRMLVLADTVSNQRAMLHDLRIVGDRLWEKFHRGRDMQAWYYGAKQDALTEMRNNECAKKVFWEMVDDFKDIFVDFYLNVSDHKLYQLSPDQSYVFDADAGAWERLPMDEKVKGILITRHFAETIEEAWSLPTESRRQWKDWLFFDDDEPTSEELVRMIVAQLRDMGFGGEQLGKFAE